MPITELPVVEAPRAIVVGVELHDRGETAAIATAAGYAARLGAELVLAGVAPVAEPLVTPSVGLNAYPPLELPPVDQQAEIDRLAREQLEELAALVTDRVAVRTVLTWGPIGLALVETAETESADLIVVPIAHANAVGHLLHDGQDRYVLHHSSVPVLVVPATGRD